MRYIGFEDIGQEPCQEIVWRAMPVCVGFVKSLSIVRWLFQSIHALARSSCLKAASGFCFSCFS
ncbi:MAG: hypothetical protein MRQ08_04950 [Candidatus Midichloria mitochondrii]|uniref:Uncharacterized protein n=1 Tax=Midichloria mitochondrii (strain IricVA) TaxID=696127 RepID=F7XWQ2_MIDMI|nr:hypothetical protein midi_00811 [Candidatus Midichloria mitochondrii IricVA]MDJ1256824.1 hypothetical protein [Candidatus Midichloria mitochondrii]MDJ1288558.1 hypothetical protein [Candidatus Midichloria mitochondrii]